MTLHAGMKEWSELPIPSSRVARSNSSRIIPCSLCMGYNVLTPVAVIARQFMVRLSAYSRFSAVHSEAPGLLAHRILLSRLSIFG